MTLKYLVIVSALSSAMDGPRLPTSVSVTWTRSSQASLKNEDITLVDLLTSLD